jgi:DNA-binding Lrp family transcriptional regulator
MFIYHARMTGNDETDMAILRSWAVDARRSLRDIARDVGVSATTVHERARAMHRRGLIKAARLDLDLAQIDRGVQALVAVRIRPPSRSNIESFRDWVGALPETLGVFVTSGRSDFIVHVAVASNEELYAFVIDRLTSRAEIADVETSVIYEHLTTPLTL